MEEQFAKLGFSAVDFSKQMDERIGDAIGLASSFFVSPDQPQSAGKAFAEHGVPFLGIQ